MTPQISPAAAGKLLHDNNFKFDMAYTSCLKRAIRTLWHSLEQVIPFPFPLLIHLFSNPSWFMIHKVLPYVARTEGLHEYSHRDTFSYNPLNLYDQQRSLSISHRRTTWAFLLLTPPLIESSQCIRLANAPSLSIHHRQTAWAFLLLTPGSSTNVTTARCRA